MSETSSSVDPVRVREAWMDWVRGVCVALVVLHHVTRQLSFELSGSDMVFVARAWEQVDLALTPIRIPLFFLISGVLASTALAGRGKKVARRYVVPLYLYFVWSLLLAMREVLAVLGGSEVVDTGRGIAADLVFVCSGYWYLCALPLYFLLCRLTTRLPSVALIAVGAIFYGLGHSVGPSINDFVSQFTDQSSLLGSVIQNFVFFVVGARLPSLVHKLHWVSGSWKVGVPAAIAYGASVYGSYRLNSWPLELWCSLVGLVLGLAVSQFAVRDGRITRLICRIGERTLPVYVLQFFFISLMALVWREFDTVAQSVDPAVLWIYPPVLTLVIVCISLIIYRLLTQFRFGFLFVPPSCLVDFAAKWVK